MNRLFNKIALLISIFIFVSCGGNDTNKSNTQTDTSKNSYNSNSTNTTVTANLGGEGFENLAEELGYTTYHFTEKDYQFFGDPRAVKGGTLRHITSRFPNTLRTVGQNSNYIENSTIEGLCYESLITTHPVNLDFIPQLATHWKISDDKSVNYIANFKKN